MEETITVGTNVYIVTYKLVYPGSDELPEEDLIKTAFIVSSSFEGASVKAINHFSGENETIDVIAISRCTNGEVVLI